MAGSAPVWQGGRAMRPSVLVPALVLAFAAPSAAEAPASPLEGSLRDLDPLELARLAQRVGDGAVLRALEDEGASALARVRAIRATPFLDAPEAALDGLARVAHGRDPLLAPAAALAAYRIADRLSPVDVEAHESGDAIAGAVTTLGLLRDDATARPDLRRLAGFAADALAAMRRSPGGDE